MRTSNRNLTAQQTSIHPAALPGHVELAVANLDEQIGFYQRTLGFQQHWRSGPQAGLGAGGADLLKLTERPGFKRYPHATGLYHYAVLFPSQRELARAVGRLFSLHYRNYPTDHIMTKTTYLEDPEGNGIELYAESPEDGVFAIEKDRFITRRADGSLSSGREALDLQTLFAHLQPHDDPDEPIPPETRIGHIHLHVSHLGEAVEFYQRVIGFDLMGVSHSLQAAFLSAGGYHHHIGLNTWQGAGAPLPLADALGLETFTIVLPDEAAWQDAEARILMSGIPYEATPAGMRLFDPSRNGVMLTLPPTGF